MAVRMIVLMVERYSKEGDELFAPRVAEALRQYAAGIDTGVCGTNDTDRFPTDNGCTVKVIAGSIA